MDCRWCSCSDDRCWANMWSLWIGHDSAERAALRAGHLALANAVSLFFASHLSFVANFLSLSLHTFKRVHRFCGLMTAAHMAAHGIMAIVGVGQSGEASTPTSHESMVSVPANETLVHRSLPSPRLDCSAHDSSPGLEIDRIDRSRTSDRSIHID
jgi:hypothetical protein